MLAGWPWSPKFPWCNMSKILGKPLIYRGGVLVLRHTNFGFENKHIKPTQPKQRCEKAFFCDTQGLQSLYGNGQTTLTKEEKLERNRFDLLHLWSSLLLFEEPCSFFGGHSNHHGIELVLAQRNSESLSKKWHLKRKRNWVIYFKFTTIPWCLGCLGCLGTQVSAEVSYEFPSSSTFSLTFFSWNTQKLWRIEPRKKKALLSIWILVV